MINKNNLMNKLSTDQNKKDDKKLVPSSLVIYMKTNLPDLYSLTYRPDMSVPKDKDTTIQFNPLVKLYKPVVDNNPNIKMDKNGLFTQFFNKKQFDTLINTTLSNFKYMQPKRTLEQAKQEGIIDNNIEIILNTLFKEGNVLYLNNKPYTILGKKWVLGDWQIDKKPIDSKDFYASTLNMENAEKELNSIPEDLRQGSMYSKNLKNEELKSRINEELNRNIQKENESNTALSIDDPKLLKKYPNNYKTLLGEFLTENNAVNMTDVSSLVQDPLALTILYNKELLKELMDNTDDENLIQTFINLNESKKQLYLQYQKFDDSFVKLTISKKKYNKVSMELSNNILAYKKNPNNISYDVIYNGTRELIDYKNTFLNNFLDSSGALVEYFKVQEIYFKTMISFITLLKSNYRKAIGYFKEPKLAWECFDSDLETYNYFAQNIINLLTGSTNKNIDDYTKDNNFFIKSYKYMTGSGLLDKSKKYNLNEETQKYIDNPLLLKVENYQYDIYSFQVLLYLKLNELNVWKIKYNSTNKFSNNLINKSKVFLEKTSLLYQEYKKKYPIKQQEEFFEKNDIIGFKYGNIAIGSQLPKEGWYLINSKLEPAIKEKSSPQMFMKSKDKNEVKQEQMYIAFTKSVVESYDYIVLTTYVLEKECGQNLNLLIAENNVSNIREEISNLYLNYYDTINEILVNNLTNPVVPESWMWDVSEEYKNQNFINKMIKSSFSMKRLYIGQINSTDKKIKEVIVRCNNIYDAIFPNMGEKSFLNQCNSLLVENIASLSTYKKEKIDYLNNDDYDIKNSKLLNDYIEDFIFRTQTESIMNFQNVSYNKNWMVYDNIGKGDCFFASVKDLFNAQMEQMNATTNNIYTEVVNGKKVYTIKSLRKAVADNFTINMYNDYLAFLKLPDGTIIPKDQLNIPDLLGLYNLLIDDTNGVANARSYDKIKQIIMTPCDGTTDALFWADQITINIIENVFKIKFIIFDITPFDPHPNFIRLGDEVKYKNNIVGDDNNYRVFQIDSNNRLYLKGSEQKKRLVNKNKLEVKSTNLNDYFRILCYDNENVSENPGYVYLLKNEGHYEAVYNSGIQKYVSTFNDIPIYIKYMIYDNCYRFLQTKEAKRNISFAINPKFKNLFKEFEGFDKNNTKSTAVYTGGADPTPFAKPYYFNYPMNYETYKNLNRYNVSGSKDGISNLSYFINMDIDLYPGEDITNYDKVKGKCNTTFEKIRKSWADIFGYEYRPSGINLQKSEEENKEEKKEDNNNLKENTEKQPDSNWLLKLFK